MDRGAAAEAIAKMLLRVGVDESVESLFRSIDRPGGQQKQTWADIKRWYENEDEEVKGFLRFLVKECMILAVFGIAVEFDGASVGYDYVDALPIKFTLGLQSYLNTNDAFDAQNPVDTIQICPTTHGEDVHDIFSYYVDHPEEAQSDLPK